MRISGTILRAVPAWIVVLALSTGAGVWSSQRHREELLAGLMQMVRHCAVAFATDDTALLSATRADIGTPAYEAVKRRLQRIRQANPQVRFAYLFRSTDMSGRVVFLADSEPPDSKDISLPGDDYDMALTSPGLQQILRTQEPSNEGPLRDEWGEWFTAYAPVGDRALPGAPSVILGIDVESAHWRRDLAARGVEAFAVVFLVLGVPLGLIQFLRRKRSLTREIRRLSAAIQQSHSAIFILSPARAIEYANDGALAVTGYTRPELLGRGWEMLLPPGAAIPGRADEFRPRAPEEQWRGELRLRRRNGEAFPARASFSPVRAGDGSVSHVVAVLDDISDLKKAEGDLRLARDQAQSADRAKGEFLAVMSHELRTPLNGIIGFAELLRETSLTPEQADYAVTIRKSGEALLSLTNELLDFSRLDAGRMQLDLQTCSPRHVVEEAVDLLSARAAEKQLELLVAIAPDVPLHVSADPGRLRQVLVNLLGNAIKFTPAGEVEVELSVLPPRSEDAEGWVQLEFRVCDSGIGIAPEKQDRLFLPFSQLDGTNTRKYGGAGLGLAISRSLVQLMHGEIEVTSAAGQGAVFRFCIPVQLVESAPPLAALPPSAIQVVAPNARARAHYARMLGRWGFQPQAVATLEDLPTGEPSAPVIVDIPDREAADWLKRLSASPALRGRPVIGFVSLAVPPTLRDDLRRSLRSLLKKPVRDALLHAVLQNVLKS